MVLKAEDYSASGVMVPAGNAEEITPDDSDLAQYTRAIYVGTAGDLAVVMAGEGVGAVTPVITFVNVNAGTILPIRVARIQAATTASDIVAIF